MRKLINMLYKYKGTELGARLIHPYRSPRETLAATSSRPNSEALTACVVLAHSYAVFYPCTDGLLIDAATVATALSTTMMSRLLSRRPQGGGDRDRLLLYRCETTLDRCSNSSSTTQRV
jgi:hypothetical protein